MTDIGYLLYITLNIVIYIVAGFTILYIAYSLFILFIHGGYGVLASKYPLSGKFNGKKLKFKTGNLGGFLYIRMLTVGANAEGLFLSIPYVFRMTSPHVFVPWEDIGYRQTEKRSEFYFLKVKDIRLTVFIQIGKGLLTQINNKTTYQSIIEKPAMDAVNFEDDVFGRISQLKGLLLKPIEFLKPLQFWKIYQKNINISKRHKILHVTVMISCVIGVWLLKSYDPIRPLPGIEDLLGQHKYFFGVNGLLILAFTFYYCRQILLSLFATVFFFVPLLGVFFFLNEYLDDTENISYLIIEKYENQETQYLDYFLKGQDQKTERVSIFKTTLEQYNVLDLSEKKYWIHVEEGKGFFNLLWRRKIIEISEQQ